MALASQVFACTPTVSVEAILDSLLRIAATGMYEERVERIGM